ncbi:abscission/NoCut checkpoint regulator isoform X1 [Aythya fuligula]|uniref:Abscission/NoCut checkpoint regulator isoform X1 n=2 Tax=Aythya fuligula TaxID=219594 RepID=A0A6J3CYP4_AYTFU|nr:abscission/NoCut checkpoint regulator isoform X1 [Aythya fuligula]XP_032044201.1 abscission/NoCut checkpoint regulator isoform X1 [Aythya fuligula]XP_032044202.1 abscission/NoCut checkpoint regulator isoform X1 [Aythya fuligula]
MDSRCYGCARKFGVFKKECGCASCGRAFCSSCLSFSAAVPRCGGGPQKVCKQCHGRLTGQEPQNSSAKWSPPENYKKRVAAFEAKQNQMKGQQKATDKSPGQADSRYQGLSKEDRAIAERLQKLREERKPKSIPSQAEIEARLAALKEDYRGPVPSTQEMEDRLAVLQGRCPPSQAPKPVHRPPDTRSLTQQTDDLLTQLAEEVAIDEHYSPGAQPQAVSGQNLNDLNRESEDFACRASLDPKQLEEEKNKLLAEAAAELRDENTRQEKILEVAKRLAVLRGQDPEKVTLETYKLPDSDEELDEEEAIRRVLKQLTEEVALDEASGFNIPPDQTTQPGPSQQNLHKKTKQKSQTPTNTALARTDDSDEDELPWCCICNEDATLRCHGCDGDLYCQRCFREGHDEFDLKDHHTSRYHLPRK